MNHKIDSNIEIAFAEKDWIKLRDILNEYYGEAVFKSWFSYLSWKGFENRCIILSVPTMFIKEWIISNYLDQIIQLAKKVNKKVLTISLIVKKRKEEEEDLAEKDKNSQFVQNAKYENSKKYYSNSHNADNNCNILDLFEETHIDLRYDFDNFVVGDENRLAFMASKSIAENKKVCKGLNPFYLHAGVGLGKTHLLQAVASYIQNHSDKKCVFISADVFLYHYVKSVRENNLLEFKQSFDKIDVLLFDDVQFLCGKKSTQQEFIYIFNLLIEHNKQIIIACDRNPYQLENMEERIKSRLGAGLVVGINQIGNDLKYRILDKKLKDLEINCDKKIKHEICNKFIHNVREIEGVVNRLVAMKTMLNGNLSSEQIYTTLVDLIGEREKKIENIQIVKFIAKELSVSVEDIYSKKRFKAISIARHIAIYLSKVCTEDSLVQIGKQIGNRDHPTIIYSIKKIEDKINKDRQFAQYIDNVKSKFYNYINK